MDIDRNGRLARMWCLGLVVLLLIETGQCQEQDTPSHACGHSTVTEAWGNEFASKAEVFLAKLQSMVRTNDKEKFAAVVHYPIQVSWGDKSIEISNSSAFVRKYHSIMTPVLRNAILSQDPKCLFANGQGVMVGHGELWYQAQKGGLMKIITITLDTTKKKM